MLSTLEQANRLRNLPGRDEEFKCDRWMGVLPGYYFGRNTLTGTVGYYADRGPFVVHQRNDFNMTMQIANHLLHHRGIDGPAQGPVRAGALSAAEHQRRVHQQRQLQQQQQQFSGPPPGLTEVIRGNNSGNQ